MDTAEMQHIHAAEERFKQRLVELGLLTKITSPPAAEPLPRDRQPVPVTNNAVSEMVMEDRRSWASTTSIPAPSSSVM